MSSSSCPATEWVETDSKSFIYCKPSFLSCCLFKYQLFILWCDVILRVICSWKESARMRIKTNYKGNYPRKKCKGARAESPFSSLFCILGSMWHIPKRAPCLHLAKDIIRKHPSLLGQSVPLPNQQCKMIWALFQIEHMRWVQNCKDFGKGWHHWFLLVFPVRTGDDVYTSQTIVCSLHMHIVGSLQP